MNGLHLAGTPLVVDYWKMKNLPPRMLFFLSHMHADHTSGLSSSWPYAIHCTPITAKLLRRKFNINNIVELQLNEPTLLRVIPPHPHGEIPITVTAIDANHCPGSAMFLFEGYFGRILYTGDFRYSPAMDVNPYLNNSRSIDILYLDNTYCDESCVFPTREEATEMILTLIRSHPNDIVYIGLHSLGKEDLLCTIATSLETRVGVDQKRMELFKLLEMPDVFDVEMENCWVRVYSSHLLAKNYLREVREEKVLGILPTSLYVGDGAMPHPVANNIKVIPYSDHSSFSELKKFVGKIRPHSVRPIVHSFTGENGVIRQSRTDMRVFHELLDPVPLVEYGIPSPIKALLSARSDSYRYPLVNGGAVRPPKHKRCFFQSRRRGKGRGVQFISPPRPKRVRFEEPSHLLSSSISEDSDEDVIVSISDEEGEVGLRRSATVATADSACRDIVVKQKHATKQLFFEDVLPPPPPLGVTATQRISVDKDVPPPPPPLGVTATQHISVDNDVPPSPPPLRVTATQHISVDKDVPPPPPPLGVTATQHISVDKDVPPPPPPLGVTATQHISVVDKYAPPPPPPLGVTATQHISVDKDVPPPPPPLGVTAMQHIIMVDKDVPHPSPPLGVMSTPCSCITAPLLPPPPLPPEVKIKKSELWIRQENSLCSRVVPVHQLMLKNPKWGLKEDGRGSDGASSGNNGSNVTFHPPDPQEDDSQAPNLQPPQLLHPQPPQIKPPHIQPQPPRLQSPHLQPPHPQPPHTHIQPPHIQPPHIQPPLPQSPDCQYLHNLYSSSISSKGNGEKTVLYGSYNDQVSTIEEMQAQLVEVMNIFKNAPPLPFPLGAASTQHTLSTDEGAALLPPPLVGTSIQENDIDVPECLLVDVELYLELRRLRDQANRINGSTTTRWQHAMQPNIWSLPVDTELGQLPPPGPVLTATPPSQDTVIPVLDRSPPRPLLTSTPPSQDNVIPVLERSPPRPLLTSTPPSQDNVIPAAHPVLESSPLKLIPTKSPEREESAPSTPSHGVAHWRLSSGNPTLDMVVAEICSENGISTYELIERSSIMEGCTCALCNIGWRVLCYGNFLRGNKVN